MTNPDRAHGFRRRNVTAERLSAEPWDWQRRNMADIESRELCDTCGGSKGSTVHVLPGPMARHMTKRLARFGPTARAVPSCR